MRESQRVRKWQNYYLQLIEYLRRKLKELLLKEK